VCPKRSSHHARLFIHKRQGGFNGREPLTVEKTSLFLPIGKCLGFFGKHPPLDPSSFVPFLTSPRDGPLDPRPPPLTIASRACPFSLVRSFFFFSIVKGVLRKSTFARRPLCPSLGIFSEETFFLGSNR